MSNHKKAGMPVFISDTINFGFPGGTVVKNRAANAGDSLRDASLILGSGRSPGGGNGNPGFLPRKFPWTEEPNGLQSMGSQRVGI